MTDEPARVVFASRVARRDHLHGAWWPRSADLVRELPLLLAAVPPVLRPVHGVTLNRAEWPTAPLMFKALPVRSPALNWYGLDQPWLAVLHCAPQTRLMLLALPPETDEELAHAAMLLATTPGNASSTTEVLELARHQVAAAPPTGQPPSDVGVV